MKLTFAKGASLEDPSRLFNASLEGNIRRAIDLHEGDDLDADAFKTLIRAAVALNRSRARLIEPGAAATAIEQAWVRQMPNGTSPFPLRERVGVRVHDPRFRYSRAASRLRRG